jgi:hypothetical protein
MWQKIHSATTQFSQLPVLLQMLLQRMHSHSLRNTVQHYSPEKPPHDRIITEMILLRNVPKSRSQTSTKLYHRAQTAAT